MNFEDPSSTTEELIKKPEEVKNDEQIDTVELAQSLIDSQAKLDKMNQAGGAEYEKTLKSINTETQEQESSIENHEEKRKEVVNKIYQMVIDDLEASLEKKGLAGFFLPKKEIREHIARAKVKQSQGLDRINVAALYAFDREGIHVNKNVKKEIAEMIKNEVSEEDQDFFTDRMNLVRHGMTEVSKG